MRLSDMFHDLELPYLKTKAKETQYRYRTSLRSFQKFAGNPEIEEITDKTMKAYKAWVIKSGLAEHTADIRAKAIKSMIRRVIPNQFAWRIDTLGRKIGRIELERPEGSLGELFFESYYPVRLIDVPKATIVQFETSIRTFQKFLGHVPMLTDLTDANIAGWMRQILESGRVVATVNSRVGYVLTLWRHAEEMGVIKTRPRVRKLKQYWREPDAWTREEFGMILYRAAETTGYIGEIPSCKFWPALLTTIYYTGLRRRAILSVGRKALNFTTGILDVGPMLMKNRCGKKFRLPPECLAQIAAMGNETSEKLFPTPWTHCHAFNRRLDGIIEAAGLPTGPRQKLHKIRRTTATLVAAESGMPAAMAILGHSEAYVTARYVDPSKLPSFDVGMYVPAPIMPVV